MVTNATGPDWRPVSWDSKYKILWQRVEDVYQALCTPEMRRVYLEQAKAEADPSYDTRIALATMDESLKRAISSNAGLLNEFEIKEDSPEQLLDDNTNVTIDNDNLKTYQGKVVHSAFKTSFVLLGCHIAPRDEGGDNRTPYFSLVSAADIFAPLVQRRYDPDLASIAMC